MVLNGILLMIIGQFGARRSRKIIDGSSALVLDVVLDKRLQRLLWGKLDDRKYAEID